MIDLAKYTKQLSKLLETSDNILLICHINPDGDAVGSQLALYQYLNSRGKNVNMISPNNLQEFLKWMTNAGLINIFIRKRSECISLIEKANLIIMIDFNQPGRLGEAENYVTDSTAKKVIIDHHLDPHNFADLIISDPSKCSTAELIYELISQINGKPFTDIIYFENIYMS